jgi:hypothetical protein
MKSTTFAYFSLLFNELTSAIFFNAFFHSKNVIEFFQRSIGLPFFILNVAVFDVPPLKVIVIEIGVYVSSTKVPEFVVMAKYSF